MKPSDIALTVAFLLASVLGCSSDTAPADPDDSCYVCPPLDPILIDEHPTWTSDGDRIIYYHYGVTEIVQGHAVFDPDSQGLWIIDTLATRPQLLAKGPFVVGRVAHLDNAVAIATNQIYRSVLVGDSLVDPVQLTTIGSNFDPSWSWDDMSLAFESNASGLYKIWRMNSDGNGKRMIPLQWGPRVSYVDWFPSGGRIIASAYDLDSFSWELVVFDTTGAVLDRLARSSASETRPRVAPDGETIAFERSGQIWIVKVDDTGLRPLVLGRHPAWSPDGQFLAYVSNEVIDGVMSTVWIVNVQTGAARQLTNGPKLPRLLVTKQRE